MTFHFPLFLIRFRLLSQRRLKVNTTLKLSVWFQIIKGQYAFTYWDTSHSNTTASRKLLHLRYAMHAQIKKKHHKHRYKVKHRNTSIKNKLTMNYSYVPELSDIFHLSKEEKTIFSYTEMFTSEIFLLPARSSKAA